MKFRYSKDPTYRAIITSPEWRRLRAKKLRDNPFCERCKADGILTWATEVHHIRPVESVKGREAMERLAFNESNLQSLCHACHKLAHRELGFQSKEQRIANRKEREKEFFKRFL